MPVFSDRQRDMATAMVDLSHCNPFGEARINAERRILGDGFVGDDRLWSWSGESNARRPNIAVIRKKADALAVEMRKTLLDSGEKLRGEELTIYTDFILFTLFHRYDYDWQALADAEMAGQQVSLEPVAFYDNMCTDVRDFCTVNGHEYVPSDRMPHLMAIGFQLRRAFHYIFQTIVGSGKAASELRMSVWESIVTHNTRRYSKGLYAKMAEIPTLICGPSGTGKELVARAIGWARYIPFDGKRKCYEGSFVGRFYPISLAALSSSVIESELFGHSRGSFTGATGDRAGFFEVAGPHGTVFLDEIGEVSLDIQVKLLRVLQTRMFQRMGDTAPRRFEGKIVAATNADLVTMMREGSFREDLFYRLCADLVETPSLNDQIQDDPEALTNLLHFISKRVVGPDLGVDLARDVHDWIHKELPSSYHWPGNIRELEQCVRNVLVRNRYLPVRDDVVKHSNLGEAVKGHNVQLNELVQWYCTEVYAQSKGYEDAANKLGIDPRTLKSKIDWERLEKLQGD